MAGSGSEQRQAVQVLLLGHIIDYAEWMQNSFFLAWREKQKSNSVTKRGGEAKAVERKVEIRKDTSGAMDGWDRNGVLFVRRKCCPKRQ